MLIILYYYIRSKQLEIRFQELYSAKDIYLQYDSDKVCFHVLSQWCVVAVDMAGTPEALKECIVEWMVKGTTPRQGD